MTFAINIHGSAASTCENDKLGFAHRFVRATVDGIMDAGGSIVVFLSFEPKHEPSGLPLVFDWIAVEEAYSYCTRHNINEARIHIITGELSEESRISKNRTDLLSAILSHSIGSIHKYIDEGEHTGERIRESIAEVTDGIIALGGGKGVNLIHSVHGRRTAVLPINSCIGDISNLEQGASHLWRMARRDPERFFRFRPTVLRNALSNLDLDASNAEAHELAEMCVGLLQMEADARKLASPGPPIVLMAFASTQSKGRYLRNLPKEQRGIQRALDPHKGTVIGDIVTLMEVTGDDLRREFRDERRRDGITIFHFGGHASGVDLIFADERANPASVHANGLADFLGAQKGLVLVFLNGCSTCEQISRLREVGVKAVVATSREIRDDVAAKFASQFYAELMHRPIPEAFAAAQGATTMEFGDEVRALVREPASDGAQRLPWVLEIDEDYANWTLFGDSGR